MNIPLVPNEESSKMDTPTTIPKEDAMRSTNEHVPTEARTSIVKKHMYDDDSSSSGDEEEDDDDDDDEDDSNHGKIAAATATNAPDGKSSVLQIPLRYTKSGRKRSIPFPVRVRSACD